MINDLDPWPQDDPSLPPSSFAANATADLIWAILIFIGVYGLMRFIGALS